MTNVELYVNLMKEACNYIEKAQELIASTVCVECKKNKFKRGCSSCRVKKMKTYLTKIDYCDLVRKCMYSASDLFGSEADKEVDGVLIEKLNVAVKKKAEKRKKVTEFGRVMNIDAED
jgi:hypothetical protein